MMAADPRIHEHATGYIAALRTIKAHQPILSRLRCRQQSAERFLLLHIPHGCPGEAHHYRQDNQRWVMHAISLKKLPTYAQVDECMTRHHFTAAEKSTIFGSRNASREERRILTSLDFDEMEFDDEDFDGCDYYDKGEAMYIYRKATYEKGEEQSIVSTARRMMRYHEGQLKALCPNEFKMSVDGADIEFGVKSMALTTPMLRQYLLEHGLSRARVELYLSMRRRPLMERRVNDVGLSIDEIDQPPDVFGVYRRPVADGNEE